MQSRDTIVALSTPPGRSGIGVIRLSGPRSLEITRALVSDNQFTLEPNHARLQTVYDLESKDALDRALITYFKAPHSFTGEDVVELSCHGSPVLLRRLVDLILTLDARLAGPGEFTLRALSNGRINLSQAEAVRDLINAQTESAIKQAARQLRGELSSYLQPIKDSLLDIIVPLESSLEFVEDDLPDIAINRIKANLSDLIEKLDRLATTYRSGHLLKDGLKVTLAGRPNVGKSSVFNSLLSSERAIVTDVPGTTRDSLSEMISIRGVPVLLIDTAGMRATEDKVENLGVERTRRAIADADLILIILDGSEPVNDEDKEVMVEVRDLPHIVALNKADLESFRVNGQLSDAPVIPVSAKTGAGLDELRAAILKPFADGGFEQSGLLITDARHHDLLRRTQNALEASARLLEQHASEELVLAGLYDALRFLGQITGETTTEDVLSQIFATFCIGK
ncbi:MAG TPA: tRNA uridine-5-carboxymethylaminomethyl(34) synthesis GTPase MnmE [Pyrinomonadaceae bacterium]|nr:tRNA uridine-5-carboxymethylaminomethyl(34) synthesis GTPase MnmE [Pyrinomonadaceae bacterium]